MPSLNEQLHEWREAGLLDEEAAIRIAEYERQKQKVRSAQPVLIELFAYLGLVIVGAGVFVLVAVNWEHLAAAARVVVLALPGAAALPLGRMLATSREAGLRRGGAMTWLLSLVLLTGSVGVASHELGWDAEAAVFTAGVVGLFLAAVLWALNREYAQLLGLAAAATLLSIGLAAFSARYLSDANTATLFGAAMVLQFAAGTALVRLGIVRPQITAGILALLGFSLGAVYFSAGLASRFDGFQGAIAFSVSLLVFSVWEMIGTRLGLLIPKLLAGMLSQLSSATATVFFAVGVAGVAAPANDEAATAGVIIIVLAGAMAALTESDVLTPRLTARLLGCLGLVAGSIAAAAPDGPVAGEIIPLLVGAALVGLSLKRGTFLYMAGGLVAMFIGFVMPVARHVSDPTVAAILMIAIGLVLLGVLALLARFRPWSRGRKGPGSPFAGGYPPQAHA